MSEREREGSSGKASDSWSALAFFMKASNCPSAWWWVIEEHSKGSGKPQGLADALRRSVFLAQLGHLRSQAPGPRLETSLPLLSL